MTNDIGLSTKEMAMISGGQDLSPNNVENIGSGAMALGAGTGIVGTVAAISAGTVLTVATGGLILIGAGVAALGAWIWNSGHKMKAQPQGG